MKTCRELARWFDEKWPEALALDWDNVGLMTGRAEKEVQRVYVALDATEEVIRDAIQWKADMIFTHHPLIFNGVKKITEDEAIGRKLLALISNDIACYSGHTSFDIACGGMADLAVEKMKDLLSEEERRPLEETGLQDGIPVGVGKTVLLKRPLSAGELAEEIKKRFDIPAVSLYSEDPGRKISRISISPGSGKSMIPAAREAKTQLLITGDMGHHEGLDLMECGIALIDAGHYGLEHIFTECVSSALAEEDYGLTIRSAPKRFPCCVL